ncbi:MAG: type II toxin-antitoxin system RelE/ParE family toxin [Betaproteobacteria bacterium]|nr:type II toxin-antitoxin system RelE/ParE family toxin [Betaproteobacteria bacterium]
MRVFKTRVFNRWARRESLADEELCKAVAEMQKGLVDAQLGGGVYKKRVARAGEGKRGGYRVILATNFRERWFFMFGFAKNERDNVDEEELKMLKQLAAALLGMKDLGIEEARKRGELVEIDCGKQEIA